VSDDDERTLLRATQATKTKNHSGVCDETCNVPTKHLSVSLKLMTEKSE